VWAYCVRCKRIVDVAKPKPRTMKNGDKITKGVCSECGKKVFCIGG